MSINSMKKHLPCSYGKATALYGNRNLSRRDKGFTMVELMVAMTLSLILLGGVLNIFLDSKQTYRVQEANSRLQESGRSATALLQRDIRPAGYQGCRSMSAIEPTIVANAPVPAIDADNVITGHEASGGSWTPALPAGLGTVVAGTDVVTIQRASDCGASLVGNMGTDNANIQINASNACNFSPNEVLIISDCVSADVFRATSVSNGTGPDAGKQTIAHANDVNTDNKLSKAYDDEADLLKFSSFTYFIRNGADGQPSLWRFDNTSAAAASVNPIELVPNVADMQIEYGVDANSDSESVPDYYITADTVNVTPDWDSVVDVRISLLVQTQSDTVAMQPQTFTFNRTNTTAADRRLYRVFTTTILLRNKVS